MHDDLFTDQYRKKLLKRTQRMPWRKIPMKDVVGCDKLRGGAEQPLNRRFPNGETRLELCLVTLIWSGLFWSHNFWLNAQISCLKRRKISKTYDVHMFEEFYTVIRLCYACSAEYCGIRWGLDRIARGNRGNWNILVPRGIESKQRFS